MKSKRTILAVSVAVAVILAAGWYFLATGHRGGSHLKPADAYSFYSNPDVLPQKNLSGALSKAGDLAADLVSYDKDKKEGAFGERTLQKEDDLASYLTKLSSLANEIQVQGLFVQSYLRQVSERSAKEWDKKIAARARAEERLFAKRSDRLASKLTRIEKNISRLFPQSTIVNRKSTITSLSWLLRFRLSRLARYLDSFSEPSPVLGVLSYHSPNYGDMEFTAGEAIIPAYLGGPAKGVVPGDTEEVLGAEITQEIIDKAEELGSAPIPLYEYVKNNFSYEPYFGSMKGALETLRQGAGNDADLSSLLIALFRASDWPARYVHGQAELNFCKAANWLGLKIPGPTTLYNFKDERRCDGMKDLVFQALSRAGIPFKPVVQGGKVVRVQVERVWVEAYVPYGNYRGAVLDNVGESWIPLDPAMVGLDRYGVEPGPLDILAEMQETGETITGAYLEAAPGPTPLEFYKEKVSSYLASQQPDLTYEDILAKRTLVPEPLGLLPNTLTFDVPKVIHEYAVLPEELRHRVKLTFFGSAGLPAEASAQAGEKISEYLLDLPETSGKRLTISYAGATPEDEAVITANGGLMTTPPYLVKVTPLIRLNGVILSGSEGSRSIGLGLSHKLEVEIISPRGSEHFTYSLLAGNYYGLGLGSSRTSFKDPDAFIQCPTGTNCSLSPGAGEGGGEGVITSTLIDSASDADGMGGRLLYQRAADYMNGLYQGEEEIAASLNLRLIRPASSLALIGNELEVISTLGIPQSLEWKGVKIDARSRPIYSVPLVSLPSSSPTVQQSSFMLLSGFQSSSLENKVFELGFGVEAVSAVKAIQLAHAQGMEVLKIDSSNLATQLPLLDVSDEVREDIINKVNQGLSVTIHLSPLSYQSWLGSGYIAVDPQTKEASYLLQGNILGGMTVADPRGNAWPKDIKDILENPNPPKPANPEDAKSISKVATTDWQYGNVWEVMKPLQVLVTDSIAEGGRPVKGAKVVFQWMPQGTQSSSEGLLSADGGATWDNSVEVSTNALGIAQIWFRPYKYIAHHWTGMKGDPYEFRVGLNEVLATLKRPNDVDIVIKTPFFLIGKAGEPAKLDDKLYYEQTNMGVVDLTSFPFGMNGMQLNGSFWPMVLDQYDNPVANKTTTWMVMSGGGRLIKKSDQIVQFATPLKPDDPEQVTSIDIYGDEDGLASIDGIAGEAGEIQEYQVSVEDLSLLYKVRVLEPQAFWWLSFPAGLDYGIKGQEYPDPVIVARYYRDPSEGWKIELPGAQPDRIDLATALTPKVECASGPTNWWEWQYTYPVIHQVLPIPSDGIWTGYFRAINEADQWQALVVTEKEDLGGGVFYYQDPCDFGLVYDPGQDMDIRMINNVHFSWVGEVGLSAVRESATHEITQLEDGGVVYTSDFRIGFKVNNPAGYSISASLKQADQLGADAKIVYSGLEYYEVSPLTEQYLWFPFVPDSKGGKLTLVVYAREHYLEAGEWKERKLPTKSMTVYVVGKVMITAIDNVSNDPVEDRPAVDEIRRNSEAFQFVSEYPAGTAVQIRIGGEVRGMSYLNDQIEWEIKGNPSSQFGDLVPVNGNVGSDVTFAFVPATVPPPRPSGRGTGLSYKISACVNINGSRNCDYLIITQDNKDDLRQEYIDVVGRVRVNGVDDPTRPSPPPRSAFAEVTACLSYPCLLYTGYLGQYCFQNTPCLGLKFDLEVRHRHWVYGNLIYDANSLDNFYTTGDLSVTSGYRCPSRNIAAGTTGGVKRSYHQWGRALDYDQQTSCENWDVWIAAGNDCDLSGICTENILYGTYIPTGRDGQIGKGIIPKDFCATPPDYSEYTHGHVAW